MVYYEDVDYWVRYIEFPNMASESVVASNGDGTFNIYINTLFCPTRQKERLAHEVRHLTQEHFYRDNLTVVQIERLADGLPPEAVAAATSYIAQQPLLPNVFEEASSSKIPVFHSLESLRNYMYAMREQYQATHSSI